MAVSVVGTPALVTNGNTYTAESGSNRVLVIALPREEGGSNRTITAVSLGASSLANSRIIEAIKAEKSDASPFASCYIWYIKEANIEAGAQTLSATWSGSVNGTTNNFTCWTLAGVDQTTPVDSTDTQVITTPTDPWTDTLTVVANSAQVMVAVDTNDTDRTYTFASGFTGRNEFFDATYGGTFADKVTASAGSITWTVNPNSTAIGSAAIASFAPLLVAPTFGVSPTVTSQTASAYTIGYTADANATNIYVGSYLKDATAPTASELKAGTGAHGTATEAATGSSDSIVLTPSEATKFPIYDVYAVLEGAGGFSSVVALVDEMLDAPSGKQFVTLASVSGTSPLTGASPTIVAGDIWVLDTLSTPGSYTITPDTAGDFVMDAGADETRQSFAHDVYDVSVGAYYGAGTVYVNNHAPNLIAGEGSGLIAGQIFKKDENQGTIGLAALVEDEESDSFTFAVNSGALPTGWSVAANGNVTGTPTVYGNYSYVIRITDAIGDYLDVVDNAIIGDEIPNEVGVAQATAIAAIEAVANFTVVTPVSTAYSVSVPEGDVISQDPPGGQYAADDRAVTLTVSLGELLEGVLLTTFLDDSTPVPASASYLGGSAYAQDGTRYVALWPANDKVAYRGPFAHRADGALLIATSGNIIVTPVGVAMTARGEVRAAQDTPAHTHNGWPLTDAGIVCMSDIAA